MSRTSRLWRKARRLERHGAAMAAEAPQTGAETQGGNGNGLALVLITMALLAVSAGLYAWDRLTHEERIAKARAEGAAMAEREAEAVGGWEAWVHRSVNRWCRKHGKPDAFAGAGALGADGKAVD